MSFTETIELNENVSNEKLNTTSNKINTNLVDASRFSMSHAITTRTAQNAKQINSEKSSELTNFPNMLVGQNS